MNPIIYKNSFGEIHRDDDLPSIEWKDGSKEWWKDGHRHRDDKLPAVEFANGNKEWWVNGKLTRDGDLPAMEWGNGNKSWWKNDIIHRGGDLPAIERINGTKMWYINGRRHREGGLPAVEWSNGDKEWYLNGKDLSSNEVITYLSFCQKMQEKKRIRAQKKIYFWWIQICYDLEHKSGCGQRMAQRNLEVFEIMMKV